MKKNIFVYGSLIFPEVVFALTNRNFKTKNAILKNFKRFKIFDGKKPRTYPAITTFEGNQVKGKILFNVDEESLKIIDLFEPKECYYRKELKVNFDGKEVLTYTYVWNSKDIEKLKSEWSAKEFKKKYLNFYLKEVIPKFLQEHNYQKTKISNMKNEPFVSVIVCTRDRAKTLKKYALESLKKLNYKNFEVIIVDDASKDNTLELAKSFKGKFKNLRIIRNKKNKGLCYVRNLGINYAKGEIVAFTDDDCYVDKNWVKELVKTFEKNKKVACVGGKSYIRNSSKLFNPNKEIFGCNMSFKREIFNKFRFDTNIYFNKSIYYDEIDFIEQLKNSGFTIRYNNKAIVKHFHEPGECRKYAEIGGSLNCVYIHTKNMTLKSYYYVLLSFFVFLLSDTKKMNLNEEMLYGFTKLKKVYINGNLRILNLIKIPWVLYILLLKIPIKSRAKF